MKDLFIDFLNENEAFDAWCGMCERVNRIDADEWLREYIGSPIFGCFEWHRSPQGYEYWHILDRKWHEYISKQEA